MPSLEDLITHLAGIHKTDRVRGRAYNVAGHLVASTLKERWHGLPEHQRQMLIRDSGNRLWDGYMQQRRNEYTKPKEAARDAILEEQAFLELSDIVQRRIINVKDGLKQAWPEVLQEKPVHWFSLEYANTRKG